MPPCFASLSGSSNLIGPIHDHKFYFFKLWIFFLLFLLNDWWGQSDSMITLVIVKEYFSFYFYHSFCIFIAHSLEKKFSPLPNTPTYCSGKLGTG